MELLIFLKAMIVGFAISAPPGPVAVMCLTRTIGYGRLQGLLLGVGVAFADALIATVAILGLTAISAFINHERDFLRIAGGVFLIAMGVRIFLKTPVARHQEAKAEDFAHLLGSGIFLTLTNPLIILGFAGVMAAIGLAGHITSNWLGFLAIAGVFTGSMVWWVILTLFAGYCRSWMTDGHIRSTYKWLGAMLAVLGTSVLVWQLTTGT